jgi:hypothetical protein
VKATSYLVVRVFVLALSAWFLGAPANGATLTVTSLSDNGPGSLRQTLSAASPGDLIDLGVFGTITNLSGELTITQNVTIVGPGETNLTISGNQAGPVFGVGSGVIANISGMTISQGSAAAGSYYGFTGSDGGGIYNSGVLTLSNCAITGNHAGNGAPGGVSVYSGIVNGGNGGNGGGIYNAGTLVLIGCEIAGNGAGGGGWGGFATSSGSTGGNGGNGGGIYNNGFLSLSNCSVADDLAGSGGDGGFNEGTRQDFNGGYGGSGGGILNTGSLSLTSCTFFGNSSGTGGDGTPMNGGSLGGGGNAGQGGAICNQNQAVLTACTITGNSGGNGGSSSPNMAVGPIGSSGSGGSGGGVYNAGSCSLVNTIAALNQAGLKGYTTGSSPGANGAGPDLAGQLNSMGYNLVGATNGGSGFVQGPGGDLCGNAASPLNPLLGPLTGNGGTTLTCDVLPGSPVLDAGSDLLLSGSNSLATDQRGFPRRSGSHVDIGAVEFQVPTNRFQINSAIIQDGACQLTFANSPDAGFTILSSTNPAAPLATWMPIGQASQATPGEFFFIDNALSDCPAKFYKVRSP